MKFKNYFFVFVSLLSLSLLSQEALPVHQDYLSDNVFLVHPAATGIGETGKIRAAIRMEGFGVANSPQLQTLNFHTKLSALSKAAIGVVLVNNKSNELYKQQALQLTYAYHLDLDQTINFNQISFGLAMNGIQNEIGGQSSTNNTTTSIITQPIYYLNVDFGASYHLNGLSSYFTIKNLYSTSKSEVLANFDEINLKNYILGVGYFFGDEKYTQFEPSVMLQYKEAIEEKIVDINFKVYKNFDNAQAWAAISYRKSFGNIFSNDVQYISPIVGININKMMFSYTYTQQINEELYTRGPFHQISIGFNVFPGELKLPANPNINSIRY